MAVTAQAATGPADSAQSAGPRARLRRLLTWAGVIVAAALAGLLAISLTQQAPTFTRLDPTNPGPTGTRAVAELLRANGVDVLPVTSRTDAERALADGGTLVLADPSALSDAAVERLLDAATGDVVLIDPVSRTLRLLMPGAAVGQRADGELQPSCDLPDAVRAGGIVSAHQFTADDADITRCFPSGDAWALLVADRGLEEASSDAASDSPRAVVLDGELMTNEHLDEAGNAALALNLLGRDARLVWYVPSPLDSDLVGDPTLADVTPPWTTAGVALLAAAVVAAAVWRGRRFGPLVTENLPVTVRVAETLEGRAHLYRRAHDAPHAATALRADAVRQLSRSLALGARADPTTVARAAAAIIAVDPTSVIDALAGPAPTDDTGLVRLSDRLTHLVTAVDAAVRSGRTPS